MKFCVYINHVHRRVRLHDPDCVFANQGLGLHGVTHRLVDEWRYWTGLEVRHALAAAHSVVTSFPHPERWTVSECKHCVRAA